MNNKMNTSVKDILKPQNRFETCFFNLTFGNCHTLCIKNQLAGFDDFCVLFLIDKIRQKDSCCSLKALIHKKHMIDYR